MTKKTNKEDPNPMSPAAYADIAILIGKYVGGGGHMTYNELYREWNKVYRDLYKDH